MKKIISVITILTMLTAVSCDSKSNEKPISEPVETIPEESVETYREYAESDFSAITVQINRQDNEPPINVEEYALDRIEWEPMMPACRQAAIDRGTLEEEAAEHFALPEHEDLYGAYNGYLISTAYGGGAVYWLIDYDDWCMRKFISHAARIYKTDIITQNTEVVFEYNDLDNAVDMGQIRYRNGSLWWQIEKINDDATKTCCIGKLDEETGEMTYYPFPDGSYGAWMIDNVEMSSGDLSLFVYTDSGDKVYTFDTASCTYTEAEKADKKALVYIEEQDGHAVVMGDNFEIHTDLKGVEVVAETERMITLCDTLCTKIYCYDLETMERYDLDIHDKGTPVRGIGNGLILDQNNRVCTYLIPRLGASFILASASERLEYSIGKDETAIFMNPTGNNSFSSFENTGSNTEKSRKIIIVRS